MKTSPTHTYSIIAVDPKEGILGAAAASCSLAVGSMVPHIRCGIGAVNTQHYANPRIAEEVLDLMASGISPDEALKRVVANDSDIENRQLIAVSLSGEKGAWTGNKCTTPNLHKEGLNCIVAGNRLSSLSVIDAMITVYESSSELGFAERLLSALEAGNEEGGDALGRESAVLSVVPLHISERWPLNQIDLRVDEHENPVVELRRLYHIFKDRYTKASS